MVDAMDDMTDEELLALYRQRDHWITLEAAKSYHHYIQRWRHLKRELREGEQARRRAAKLERDLRNATPSPSHPPLPLAERYAAGRGRR